MSEAATVGHNQPPETLATGKQLESDILSTYEKILNRAQQLIDAEARLPAVITNEEQDAAATEYVKQIQACNKELDRVRLVAKAPYDTCSDFVHSTFRNFMDKLARPTRTSPAALKERVEAKQLAYKLELKRQEEARREEEARKAREAEQQRLAEAAEAQKKAEEAAAIAARQRDPETDRITKEAADKAAADAQQKLSALQDSQAVTAQAVKAVEAPAADMTRTRGERGGVSSLRQQAGLQSIDRLTVDLEALRGHFTKDDLEKAVRSYINANRPLIEAHLKEPGTASPLSGVKFAWDYSVATR